MFTDLILCKEHFTDLGFDKVISVNIIEPATKKELRKKLKQESGLRVVLGSSNNRTVAETKKVDILLSPEKGVKRDSLHHRNSGLDTVICSLTKKNSIAIGFNFNDILTNEGTKRAEIIGRMMQNVWLCRKYKLRMVLGSFAKDKWQMRARNDLTSFGITLGMHPEEAKKSLEAINEILKEKKEKRFMIGEGIKQL